MPALTHHSSQETETCETLYRTMRHVATQRSLDFSSCEVERVKLGMNRGTVLVGPCAETCSNSQDATAPLQSKELCSIIVRVGDVVTAHDEKGPIRLVREREKGHSVWVAADVPDEGRVLLRRRRRLHPERLQLVMDNSSPFSNTNGESRCTT